MTRKTICLAIMAATLCGAGLLIISGCHHTSTPELEKVKFLIDWKAEPTYAGFYVAKQKGFFSKRGLDVEIVEGNGATTAAQVIGSGNQYFIGSCSGEATAVARARGIPVRSVAVLYPSVPTVIYSRADTPIEKPADLIGKRIGLIDGSISVDEYRGLIQANHLDRSKIKEVSVGWDAAPLLSNKVDGLMNYEELTPVELRDEGYAIKTLRFADYGVNAYSLNIIVNDASVETQYSLIRRVVDGAIEGYEYLKANPAATATLFSQVFPERSKRYVRDSISVVAVLLGEGKVGEQSRAGWEQTLTTMQRFGLLSRSVTVDEVVVKDYLSNDRTN